MKEHETIVVQKGVKYNGDISVVEKLVYVETEAKNHYKLNANTEINKA